MSDAEVTAQLAVVTYQQQVTHDQLANHEERLRLVETAVVSLSALPQIVQDLEERQRGDERWRYALPLATIAALLSAVGTILAAYVALKGGK